MCIRLKLSSWRGSNVNRKVLYLSNLAISLFGTVALLLYFCMMGAASEDEGPQPEPGPWLCVLFSGYGEPLDPSIHPHLAASVGGNLLLRVRAGAIAKQAE